MRHLPCILFKIFDEIPDDFEHKEALSLSFGSIIESYMYASPEKQRYWWNQTAIILEIHIREPNEDWKYRIYRIFSDDSENKVNWKIEGF